MALNEKQNVMLSIIVPVYNVEKYLRECVESILRQSFKNMEIVLVDDGSTDHSGKICDEYARIYDFIRVIHKRNGGLSSARNAGLDLCVKGKYIIFLDSDDFFFKDNLATIVNQMETKKADIGAYRCFAYDGESYNLFAGKYPSNLYEKNGKSTLRELLKYEYTFGWCVWFYIFSSDLIYKNNIRFQEGYYSEDVNFTLLAYLHSKNVIKIENDFYAYRKNPNSITRNPSISYVVNIIDMIFFNLEHLDEYGVDDELKDLLYLNYQSLLMVVYYLYYCFSKENRKLIKQKLDTVQEVYQLSNLNNYKYADRKCKFVKIIVKIFGVDVVAYMWRVFTKIRRLKKC